mmetsp:Transcript_42186/g.112582  ORF Transcript_42186/g.112582 Transcript_42186/m.112582 type:complete len:103 (-) Transcript_42186:510-818(-)
MMGGPAISTLTEVLFRYSKSVASDLKHFAKHGKRTVISCDDVKLLARKLPSLHNDLEAYEAAYLTKEKAPSRKRKKSSSAGGGGGGNDADRLGRQAGELRAG